MDQVPKLKSSIINGNQVKIEVDNDLRIMSCTRDNGIATGIGIAVNSIFKENINEGDKFEIAIGNYNNVTSSNYFSPTDKLGILTEVKSINIEQNSVFGAMNVNDIFTMNDGEGLKIITDNDSVDFTYKKSSPDTANGEFNSLATLQEAIDGNSSFPLVSTQVNSLSILIHNI